MGGPDHDVLPGRPLPGPRRHPRAARRGLGREADHRARRRHRGHHDHLGRADPRPGAAHRPAVAGEGRGELVAGLRLRQAPQGRQRLGPAGPQAHRLLRHRPRGTDRRRRRAPRPDVLAVRAAPGLGVRRDQRASHGAQRAARHHPRAVAGRAAVRRHGGLRHPDQGAWCRRAVSASGSVPVLRTWCSAPTPPSCAACAGTRTRDRATSLLVGAGVLAALVAGVAGAPLVLAGGVLVGARRGVRPGPQPPPPRRGAAARRRGGAVGHPDRLRRRRRTARRRAGPPRLRLGRGGPRRGRASTAASSTTSTRSRPRSSRPPSTRRSRRSTCRATCCRAGCGPRGTSPGGGRCGPASAASSRTAWSGTPSRPSSG